MPDCARLLLQVCWTDSPIGKSNSSFQSLSGTVLKLVMVKRAIKPVCHVEVTDNVAVTAAA
ncbi:chitinase [Mycobacterium sp. CBMA 623]|nr:chitinase [Mycobacteroides sp. CBMA 326]